MNPIAVLDSDVLLLLLDMSTAPEVVRRRGFAELTIERLAKERARFVVPSPVIAELCRSQPGSDELRKVVKSFLGRARIEVLDEDAAVLAGEIARARLQARAEGEERGAIKYDTLIAAIAHKIGARWLVTGNTRDYQRCFAVIKSTVQIIRATDQTEKGQHVMLEMVKPPQAAGTAAKRE